MNFPSAYNSSLTFHHDDNENNEYDTNSDLEFGEPSRKKFKYSEEIENSGVIHIQPGDKIFELVKEFIQSIERSMNYSLTQQSSKPKLPTPLSTNRVAKNNAIQILKNNDSGRIPSSISKKIDENHKISEDQMMEFESDEKSSDKDDDDSARSDSEDDISEKETHFSQTKVAKNTTKKLVAKRVLLQSDTAYHNHGDMHSDDNDDDGNFSHSHHQSINISVSSHPRTPFVTRKIAQRTIFTPTTLTIAENSSLQKGGTKQISDHPHSHPHQQRESEGIQRKTPPFAKNSARCSVGAVTAINTSLKNVNTYTSPKKLPLATNNALPNHKSKREICDHHQQQTTPQCDDINNERRSETGGDPKLLVDTGKSEEIQIEKETTQLSTSDSIVQPSLLSLHPPPQLQPQSHPSLLPSAELSINEKIMSDQQSNDGGDHQIAKNQRRNDDNTNNTNTNTATTTTTANTSNPASIIVEININNNNININCNNSIIPQLKTRVIEKANTRPPLANVNTLSNHLIKDVVPPTPSQPQSPELVAVPPQPTESEVPQSVHNQPINNIIIVESTTHNITNNTIIDNQSSSTSTSTSTISNQLDKAPRRSSRTCKSNIDSKLAIHSILSKSDYLQQKSTTPKKRKKRTLMKPVSPSTTLYSRILDNLNKRNLHDTAIVRSFFHLKTIYHKLSLDSIRQGIIENAKKENWKRNKEKQRMIEYEMINEHLNRKVNYNDPEFLSTILFPNNTSSQVVPLDIINPLHVSWVPLLDNVEVEDDDVYGFIPYYGDNNPVEVPEPDPVLYPKSLLTTRIEKIEEEEALIDTVLFFESIQLTYECLNQFAKCIPSSYSSFYKRCLKLLETRKGDPIVASILHNCQQFPIDIDHNEEISLALQIPDIPPSCRTLTIPQLTQSINNSKHLNIQFKRQIITILDIVKNFDHAYALFHLVTELTTPITPTITTNNNNNNNIEDNNSNIIISDNGGGDRLSSKKNEKKKEINNKARSGIFKSVDDLLITQRQYFCRQCFSYHCRKHVDIYTHPPTPEPTIRGSFHSSDILPICSNDCSLTSNSSSSLPPSSSSMNLNNFFDTIDCDDDDHEDGEFGFQRIRLFLYIKAREIFGATNHCDISNFVPNLTCKQSKIINEGFDDALMIYPRRFKQRVQKQSEIVPDEKFWNYVPCFHSGECNTNFTTPCICADHIRNCEKYCSCSQSCPLRYRGCSCEGGCNNNKCECVLQGRECDPDICKCKGGFDPITNTLTHTCCNVSMTFDQHKYVIVGKSRIVGFGAFAGESIKKGEYIIEYKGELCSQEEAERRGIEYDLRHHSFLFNYSKEHVLDAARKGNKARFLNHSEKSNCMTLYKFCNGNLKVGLFATRNIEAGEELFFNYHYTPENSKFVSREYNPKINNNNNKSKINKNNNSTTATTTTTTTTQKKQVGRKKKKVKSKFS